MTGTAPTITDTQLYTLIMDGVTLAESGHECAAADFFHDLASRTRYSGAALAYWHEAINRLVCGDFERGLEAFEWRRIALPCWPLPATLPPELEWNGSQPLEGKHIVLFGEQGLGDTVQFIRYAPLLMQRGASRVSALVPPTLRRLLRSISGLHVLEEGERVDGNLFCALMSLPRAFGVRTSSDIPANVPYLVADSLAIATWRRRIECGELSPTGITWRGNPMHASDLKRSIRLADILTRFNMPLTALHDDLREDERILLDHSGQIAFVGNELHDMADTAALISALDRVITVDTAVAHLAGAMGKPTLLLLHHDRDWRWLRDGERSAWYPSLRLWRMRRGEEWPETLARIDPTVLDI